MVATTYVAGTGVPATQLNGDFSKAIDRGGDTMAGLLTLASDPVGPLDAATKQYIDNRLSPGGAFVLKIGDTMSGPLTIGGTNNSSTLSGSTTGNPITWSAAGSDAAVSLRLSPKGIGTIQLGRVDIGNNANGQGIFDGSTSLNVHSNNTFSTTCNPSFICSSTVGGAITSGNFWINATNITDNVDPTALGSRALYGMYVNHLTGSSGTWKGQRTALLSTITLNQAPATGGCIAGDFFNALVGTSQASVNLGGTVGTSIGSIQGLAAQAIAQSGATFYRQVTGVGCSADVQAGASAQYVVALQVACGHSAGSVEYAGVSLGGAPGMLGFNVGISFGDPIAPTWPIATTGTMIGTQNPQGSPAMNAGIGIDLSAVTFSITPLKMPLFTNAANDAAAQAAGIPVGGVYRNGSVMMQRVV